MTSMLLTFSMMETRRARVPTLALSFDESFRRNRGLAFLAAIPRGDALLLRVLRRGLLDHRAHDGLVGLGPVGDDVPFLPVPLHELHRAPALVVHAGDLERLHESGRAELLEAAVVDVEVLETPADLVPRHGLALAEMALGGADRLRGDDAEHDAAV